jgi:hypothetical protein
MARPSLYSDELADDICDMIANGISLRSICIAPDMPSTRTVLRWLDEKPDFVAKYERARKEQADMFAEELVGIADEADDVNKARLRIDTRKWVASKLLPKKYGDKITAEVGGPDGAPLIEADPLAAVKAIAFVLAEGQALLAAQKKDD